MLRVTVSVAVVVLISILLLGGLFCSLDDQRQKKTELERLLRQAESALAADPGDNDARFQRADILSHLQRYGESKEECDSLIDIDSTYAMAFFLRGFVISQLNPPGADTLRLRDYLMSARLNPQHARSFYNIGNVYLEWEMWDSAIDYTNKAIALDSLDTLAYYNRSLAYRYKWMLDSAYADANRVLELDPTFARAYHIRSYARYKSGDLAGALDDMSECMERSGDEVEASACFDYGDYLIKSGYREMAVYAWKRAIEIDSTFADAHFNVALVCEFSGDTEGAIYHYNSYLRYNQGDRSGKGFAKERILQLTR